MKSLARKEFAVINVNILSTQARWIPPNADIWIQFPRRNQKQAWLPVKSTQVEDPMKMIILFPPANCGAYPIKRTYWDLIAYQRVYPLSELKLPATLDEPARSPTGS